MIRIIAGSWKGRRLATPVGEETRPAAESQRQAVMNTLGPRLAGARVLDAFAGSGAFALEALSRGAASALLVELSSPALAVIRRNIATVGAGDRARVLRGDVYRLRLPGAPFDIAFIAPPYAHFREKRMELRTLLSAMRAPGGSGAARGPLLADGGIVVVQSDAEDFVHDAIPGLVRTRTRRYGRTAFAFLEPGSPVG